MLTDYEESDDEERGPAVPSKLPMGLSELMEQLSKGKRKPYEVERASFKDEDDVEDVEPEEEDDNEGEMAHEEGGLVAVLEYEEPATPREARHHWARALTSVCSFLGGYDEPDQ